MLKSISLATITTLALTGCITDDSSSDQAEQAPFVITPIAKAIDADPQYSITMSSSNVNVANGYAELTVLVNDNNNDELPNSPVSITPHMLMVSGMEHGTPISNSSGNLDENGEFTSTAYFLMPSSMNGTEMGDWTFTVEFDGESQDFLVEVDGMSDMQKLQGGSADSEFPDLIPDTMANMMMDNMNEMAMTNRSYYVFNRGRMVMGDMNSFEVYVAAREDLFTYSAISGDQTLNDEVMGAELSITTASVKMCIADCENEANWQDAEHNGEEGVYKGMDLGLAGDDTDKVQVKLIIDGVEKLKGDESRANFSFSAMNMEM